VAGKSKKKRGAERRAIVEKLQREQKARERRRSMIGAAVVVVIVLGVVAAVFFSLHNTSSSASGVEKQVLPSTPTGSTTVQTPPARVQNPTDIKGVLAWNTGNWPGPGTTGSTALAHDHVQGPVKYAVTPPVGGPHNPTWMNAGVYTKPVPPERAVHNLEHGAVWVTYSPSLSNSQVNQLVALFQKQSMIPEAQDGGRSSRYVDLSPWSSNDLPAPIVISSWGFQLRVPSASDPGLQRFIDTFRHSQKYTPEYGAPVDGIPVQIGGQPAINGSDNKSGL
jgi:hypothetical protein